MEPEDSNQDDVVLVRCKSTKGPIHIEVHKGWAPYGAERFLQLVELGYFSDIALFRVNRWIVQFGAVKTESEGAWRELIPEGRHHLPTIPDDPPTDCFGKCSKRSLFDGAVSFAGGGLDSRSGQIFIVHHRGKSQPLGESPWEIPFANVTLGLDVVRSWYSGYGDRGIDQTKIFLRGSSWVHKEFPLTDFIESCVVLARTDDEGQDEIDLIEEGIQEVLNTTFGALSLFGMLILVASFWKQIRRVKERKGH